MIHNQVTWHQLIGQASDSGQRLYHRLTDKSKMEIDSALQRLMDRHHYLLAELDKTSSDLELKSSTSSKLKSYSAEMENWLTKVEKEVLKYMQPRIELIENRTQLDKVTALANDIVEHRPRLEELEKLSIESSSTNQLQLFKTVQKRYEDVNRKAKVKSLNFTGF